MKILDRYIDQLLEKAVRPVRSGILKKKSVKGAKPSWNYMDGCMINAIFGTLSYYTERRIS